MYPAWPDDPSPEFARARPPPKRVPCASWRSFRPSRWPPPDAPKPRLPGVSRRGRYWDRTSDLCRVKVSKGSFARLQNRGIAATGLVPLGSSPLIVSHRFAVVSNVMWTRCGRGFPQRRGTADRRSRLTASADPRRDRAAPSPHLTHPSPHDFSALRFPSEAHHGGALPSQEVHEQPPQQPSRKHAGHIEYDVVGRSNTPVDKSELRQLDPR